jgi:hypothetical protein
MLHNINAQLLTQYVKLTLLVLTDCVLGLLLPIPKLHLVRWEASGVSAGGRRGSGETMEVLTLSIAYVNAVACSPDGRTLATSSAIATRAYSAGDR